jgi:ATP-binding cassette, subfamily B, multidrug efflux pump
LAILLLLLGRFLGNATPRVVQYAIDGPIARGHLDGLLFPALLFLALKTVTFVAISVQDVLTSWIGQRIIRQQRMRLFQHTLSLSSHFFSKNPVGRLMSRIVNDTEVLNELFSAGLITVFGDVFSIMFIIGFMVTLNVKLTLLSLSVLPLVLLATALFKARVRHLFRLIRIKTADINTHLQESVGGMRVIQLFNQQQNDAAKFDVHNREYFGLYRRTVFLFSLFFPVMEILGAFTLAMVLWYGGLQYLDHGVTVGVLVAFIEYVGALFNPIRNLAEKYNILQNAMASSERVFRLLDNQDRIPEPQVPAVFSDVRGRIEFQSVSFGYDPNRPVLKEVSFTVEPGQKVAIVGPTGTGKTTVINLLNRFYLPQAGRILIDGVALESIRREDLRRALGTVSQDLFAFSDSVMENIRLGNREITREKAEIVSSYINADQFIRRLPCGYEDILAERGQNLSTGQKQLLSFARVLSYDPRIIVLDEATSSVDPYTERLIQDAIEKLTQGRTCLIIAHRLSTIRYSDKIIVLHHGRVAETGTHNELVRKDGIYTKLYKLQFN